MRIITWAAAALVAATIPGNVDASVVIAHFESELTEDSPIGFDPWGEFHYEMIQFTVSDEAEYQFSMATHGAFSPFWGIFAGDYNPLNWYDPPAIQEAWGGNPNIPAVGTVVLQADLLYQIVLTTNAYNPTPLGEFKLTVEGPEGAVFTVIPAPGAFAALCIGLLGLHRRRPRSVLNQ